MHCSFIICTRNRASTLRRTLESVDRAVKQDSEYTFDLVLIDNGSTDDTAGVFDAWVASAQIKAIKIYSERPGLAASRNIGINSAQGDVLIFTDDDCVLSETYCGDLIRHLSASDEARVIGGRVELGDDSDIPLTIKVSRDQARLQDPVHPGGFILGCNMIIPRNIIAKLGLFDERFGAGAHYRSAEDTDMLYRAWREGIPVEYMPDMVIYHFHGRKTASEVKKLNSAYHYGNGALYSKYFLTDPRFAKHLYWALRNALRESRGGPRFEPECDLSHWSVVKGNIAGIIAYATDRIRNAIGMGSADPSSP